MKNLRNNIISSDRGRLVYIWVFLIVIFVIAEITFRRWPTKSSPNNTYLLMEYQKNKISTINEKSLILIGDSSLGQNIHAKTLSDLTGLSVYNLALNGASTTIGDYYIAKEVINHSRENILGIIIMHTSDLWKREESEDAKKGLRMRFATVSLEGIAWRIANLLSLTQQSRAYKDYMLRLDYGICPRPERLTSCEKIYESNIETFKTHDYTTQRKKTKNWPESSGEKIKDFDPDAHAERWLDKTLHLCNKHNIPVLIAYGPLWEKTAIRSGNYINSMNNWLTVKTHEYDNAGILYNSVPMIPSEECGDRPDHILYSAKDSFTTWFAQQVVNSQDRLGLPATTLEIPRKTKRSIRKWKLVDTTDSE